MSQDKNAQFWGKFWGTLILSVGVLLLLQTFGFIAWEVWDFVGPGLLIVWGGVILLKPESFLGCGCWAPYRYQEGTKI